MSELGDKIRALKADYVGAAVHIALDRAAALADEHQDDADALVAAAYEDVARAINERGAQEGADFGLNRGTQNFYRARARAPADARAALERIKDEARKEGMREAAGIAYRVCAETRHMKLGDKAHDAILLAAGDVPEQTITDAILAAAAKHREAQHD